MARRSRNEDELRAASDHLHYEIQMLRGTMTLLATQALGESVLSNALIESFTIHARALIHFLYPSGQVVDSDVLAEDFFDNSERWLATRPEEPTAFGRARGRVNKEIAHLTYDRQLVTPELKGWDLSPLATRSLKSSKSSWQLFHGSSLTRGGNRPVQSPGVVCRSQHH